MQASSTGRATTSPPTELFELDEGWALAPEPERSARPAVVETPPVRCPSTQEIDDGWSLPEEPAVSPAVASDPVEVVRAVGTGKVPLEAVALLDANVATLEQLCSLPGIGRLRAKRIVAARERAGGFASVDDLKVVQGIGPKTLEQLRALLTVR